MPNWAKVTWELFVPIPELSTWNCSALTTFVSALGCFVSMSCHRNSSAEYSSSVPISFRASDSPQQEIVVAGSSRRTIHLPHSSLGMACAEKVATKARTVMIGYGSLLMCCPGHHCASPQTITEQRATSAIFLLTSAISLQAPSWDNGVWNRESFPSRGHQNHCDGK